MLQPGNGERLGKRIECRADRQDNGQRILPNFFAPEFSGKFEAKAHILLHKIHHFVYSQDQRSPNNQIIDDCVARLKTSDMNTGMVIAKLKFGCTGQMPFFNQAQFFEVLG